MFACTTPTTCATTTPLPPATEPRRRHPLSLTTATMNGEFERDEHYYDDGKDEEEVILTHAEHKAQGNELYKSKGTFVLQIVRWPFFGCCMHVGQKGEPREQSTAIGPRLRSHLPAGKISCAFGTRVACPDPRSEVSCGALSCSFFSYLRLPLTAPTVRHPPRLPRSHCSLHAGD